MAGIAVSASVLTAICLVSASFLYAKRRRRTREAPVAAPCADALVHVAGQHCLFLDSRIFQRLTGFLPGAICVDLSSRTKLGCLMLAGDASPSPYNEGDGSVLWIFERELARTDGKEINFLTTFMSQRLKWSLAGTLSVAQASYGASNAPSEVSAPPPYCHQATTNRTAPLDKSQGEFTREVVPISGIGRGPRVGPNGAVAKCFVQVMFSANKNTRRTDTTHTIPSARGFPGSVGLMFGEEGHGDNADQRSTSDGSTLPPPYS